MKQITEPTRTLHLAFGLGFTVIGMGMVCSHQMVVGAAMFLVGFIDGLYLATH